MALTPTFANPTSGSSGRSWRYNGTTVETYTPVSAVNVKDYGAVMDGVTNDTTAFVAAAAALPADGGQILVPAGTTLVSGWTITKALRITGESPQATIIQMATAGGPILSVGAVGAVNGLVVEHLQLKAHASSDRTNAAHIAVDCTGLRHAIFRDLAYRSNGTGAVHAVFDLASTPKPCYANTFDGVDVAETAGPKYIWKFHNGGLGVTYNPNVTRIQNLYSYSVNDITCAVLAGDSTSTTVSNCLFESLTGAVAIQLGQASRIENNWIESVSIAIQAPTVSPFGNSSLIMSNYLSGGVSVDIPAETFGLPVWIGNTGSWTMIGTGAAWGSGTEINGYGIMTPAKYPGGNEPSAVTQGKGAMFYHTTNNKPYWSDGTVWRDAVGTAL